MASALSLAAALLIEGDTPPRLALCVVHTMRDDRFRELLNTLVEIHPSHWPKLTQIADGYRAKPGRN